MLVDIMPLKILVSAGAPVAPGEPIGCQKWRARFLELRGGGGGGQPIECQEF
jgi:hypothetical protein